MSLGQPKPPNPTDVANQSIGVAQQQAGLNTGLAQQNQAGSNYNQSDPYGSLSYSQTGTGPGGTPIYSSSVNLSPTQQNLLNLLQGTQTTAGGQAGALLGGANYGAESPTQAIGDLTGGLVQQNTAQYLKAQQPFMTTQTQQLDTQLRNQGLAPGQPAYDNAMRQLNVNQGLTVAGATAAFKPTAFGQATQEYLLPEQQAIALGGFGAPANPTQQLEGGAALNIQTPDSATDLTGLGSIAQSSYQDQQNQYNSMIKNLMGGENAVASLIPVG